MLHRQQYNGARYTVFLFELCATYVLMAVCLCQLSLGRLTPRLLTSKLEDTVSETAF